MNSRKCIVVYRIESTAFDAAVKFYGELLGIAPRYRPNQANATHVVFPIFRVNANAGAYKCQLRLKRMTPGSQENKLPVIYWGTREQDIKVDYDKLLYNHAPSPDADELLGPDPVDDGSLLLNNEGMGSVLDTFGNRTGVVINPPWPNKRVGKGKGRDHFLPPGRRGPVNPPWPSGRQLFLICSTTALAIAGLLALRDLPRGPGR